MPGLATELYDEITAFVDSERTRSLSRDERLLILRMHAHLRHSDAVGVAEHIAQLVGRSLHAVKEVWSEYQRDKTVTAANVAANRSNRNTRIPDTKQILSIIQSFVRERRSTRTRVVAKDVMSLLYEHSIVNYDPQNKKAVNACLRLVQKFLVKKGLTDAVASARDKYVQYMSTAIESPQPRPVIYMDESYIHHHYARHNDSLYHPDDATDAKPKHKGRRLCFIAAIMADGRDDSKVLTYDVFEGGRKQPKDYHAMFNHAYFVIRERK
ncbi:hypothetical protein AaE_010926 [Aphanomyces astaci]|uniref:Tc1-like transposase DDE domain-containing protein n=1 Tax=Aphanomyces astaci TaxID=112090 RepID=A0A6A5A2I2_APHAT|nr:hypothetical protein AaE_010926 [Aphanomyces astaci]